MSTKYEITWPGGSIVATAQHETPYQVEFCVPILDFDELGIDLFSLQVTGGLPFKPKSYFVSPYDGDILFIMDRNSPNLRLLGAAAKRCECGWGDSAVHHSHWCPLNT